MKVLVLKGGTSGERAVSLRSAAAVTKALLVAGYEAVEYDTEKGFEGILGVGADVVFPILHGAGGEDGSIQSFLEEHDLKYLGSNAKACRESFDKAVFKAIIASAGIPTPRSEVLNGKQFAVSTLAQQPHVLKPIDGGSSLDTFIVRKPGSEVIPGDIFERYDHMLLEELIEGDEITIGILGDEALPVVEIIPPADEEFDYDNKYNGKTQELCPPEHIDASTQREAQELALQAHRASGCRHLSRVDIIVDQHKSMFVLELNTIPGLTDQSLYPKAAQEHGLSMPQLMKQFVEMAAE
jgi:D-alanine-D-alanine ligase